MPSIKGTASVADPRARSKALKSTKFPKNFSLPLQLSKVNKPVLRQWIEQRVTTILGFEDEIVSSTAINLFLPEEEGNNPDPRRAQLDLVGFLGEAESASFAKELWGLLLEAQSSGTGIPKTLLEQKKKELEAQRMANKVASSKAAATSTSSGSNNRFSAPSDANQNARNPEMNRFVQEATRRAQAARQMVNGSHQEQNGQANAPAAAAASDVPVPVSPPPESPDVDPPRKMPIDNSNKRADNEGDKDRKMTPRERYERSLRQGPESNRAQASRGRYGGDDAGRAERPYGYGASGYGARNRERRSGDRPIQRSRSRSFERSRARDYEYRDREGFRGSRQRGWDNRDHHRRYRDEDHEIDDLEQRLSNLKRQSAKRRDDYALDEEIEDVKDRIHELERRRRRRRKERDRGRFDRGEDEYGRKRRRRDSPERSRRRSPSPAKGGESSDSSRSHSRSRSRSPSYDRKDRDQRNNRGDSAGDRRRDADDDRKRVRDRHDDRNRERSERHPSSASSSSDRSGSDSD